MKNVVMILSVVLVASGSAVTAVQAAESAPAKQGTAADREKADAAAMLALPGVLTTESLDAATRNAADTDAAQKDLSRQMAASPAVQERMRVRFREQLPTQHPDIDEVLALKPKDVERLFDLLARQYADARREANAGTSKKTPAERAKAEEAEIATMLGSKYPKWQQYKAALPMRLQVRDLNAALIAEDNSLKDAKIEPLIAALAEAQKQNSQSGGSLTPEGQQRLLDAAAAHLSPPQIEVYRKVLERQASRARAAAPK